MKLIPDVRFHTGRPELCLERCNRLDIPERFEAGSTLATPLFNFVDILFAPNKVENIISVENADVKIEFK